VPQRHEQICWRKRMLLGGPPQANKDQRIGARRNVVLAFRMGTERGANDSTSENCTITKAWESRRTCSVVAPLKKKSKSGHFFGNQ
jgi:hypothetical protein